MGGCPRKCLQMAPAREGVKTGEEDEELLYYTFTTPLLHWKSVMGGPVLPQLESPDVTQTQKGHQVLPLPLEG